MTVTNTPKIPSQWNAEISDVHQYATFYLGDLLLGIDIRQVQEINRQLEATQVPHAPKMVHGVINLRGEVATVIDLRTVLGLPAIESTRSTRTMIVQAGGESIGLIVDRISDILTLSQDELNLPPANVDGVDGRYFIGVHTMEKEIAVILSIEEVLNECETRTS